METIERIWRTFWEYEIGEAPKSFNPEADLLAPSGDNVKIYF
jgi:hypothetical protein